MPPEEEQIPNPDQNNTSDNVVVPPQAAPKTEPSSKEIDPLLLEYEKDLKSQIGEMYDPEFDQLSLKDRINNMRLIKKTMDKIVNDRKSEGNPPIKPEPQTTQKILNAVERQAQGIDPLDHLRQSKNSIFSSARKNQTRK